MDVLVGGTCVESIDRMEVSNKFQDLTNKGIVTLTKQVMFTFATCHFHWAGDTHQPEHQHIDSYSDCHKDDDITVLIKNDVPGASLNGKQPHEMNKQQLKRWLACRGAPLLMLKLLEQKALPLEH